MNRNNFKKKLGSILVVYILLFGGLGVLPHTLEINKVDAVTTWTQTSASDFDKGTCNNTTIVATGPESELRLVVSDSGDWIQQSPASKPGGRYGHAMGTIYNDDKAVLFGGYSGGYKRDTWVYDLSDNNWVDKDPSGSKPSAREYHTMASIYGTDKILLFGGYDGSRDDETWVYDLSDNTWVNKDPTGSKPSERYYHAMATIHGTDKILLFGGFVSGSPWSSNEIWVYDLSDNKWTQKFSTINPSGRYGHAMASIYNTDKVIMFGGVIGRTETWMFNSSNDNWTNPQPVGHPSKYYHSMASIYGTDKVLLFGGAGSNPPTWQYDLTDNNWTGLMTSNNPSNRNLLAMATIWGTEKVLLFGGTNGNDETWIFNYEFYQKNGTYISNPYYIGHNSTYKTISWNGTKPPGTSVNFQLRTAGDISGLLNESFLGPEGSNSIYYTSSPSAIWTGQTGEWVQYKVYFSTSTNKTPTLEDVTITYNYWPKTNLTNPENGSLLSNNQPTLSWNFTDTDSTHQSAFQVIISNNSMFNNTVYDSGEQNSSEPNWQFPNGTTNTELPDGSWYWKVRTKDNDGDWGHYSSPWEIIIDTTAPSSKINKPINNEFYNKLKLISGQAIDPMSGTGLSKVEITIKQLRDDNYWDGSDWVIEQTWLLVDGTMEWSYDTSSISWCSGNQYSIVSRAMDNSINIKLGEEVIFSFDSDKPSSKIETPINNTFLNILDTISCSAIDIGGSGVRNIQISIKCTTNNYYWDGIDWMLYTCWLNTSLLKPGSWSYNIINAQWSTDTRYIIKSRAIDNIGNIEVPAFGNIFMVDDQPPEKLSILIDNNNDYTDSASVTLSLYSEDTGSGLSHMSFSTDGIDWPSWVPYNTTHSYELPPLDGEKSIFLSVRDRANNTAEPVYDTIILDTTPPEDLIIVINDDAKYTNHNIVTLTLGALDTISGLGEMSLSNDANTWTPWEPFSQTRSFQLPTNDGEKQVYFKVSDNVGNIANLVFDSIIYDRTAPQSVSILINGGAGETNSTLVLLELNAVDTGSEVYQMSFRNDGDEWSVWEPFIPEKSFSLLPEEGEKTVYFRVKDGAGNIAEPVTVKIMLKTTTTQPTPELGNKPAGKSSSEKETWNLSFIIIFILIVVVIITVGFLIILRRKRRAEHELPLPIAVTIKPTALQPPTITQDQISISPALAQLPVTRITSAAGTGAQQPTLQTTPVPVSAPKPMPQVPIVPQLPPASVDATTQESPQKSPQKDTTSTEPLEQPLYKISRLSSQQKIKLLEGQMSRGELSEETFLMLKTKYEMDAKPYQPVPQLLTPATATKPVSVPQTEVPPETVTPSVEASPMETVPRPPNAELPHDAYVRPQVEQPALVTPQPTLATQEQPTPTITQPQLSEPPTEDDKKGEVEE